MYVCALVALESLRWCSNTCVCSFAPQVLSEWENVVARAKTPSEYLDAFHVFVLANILRRPILVFAGRLVRSKNGDAVGFCDIGG